MPSSKARRRLWPALAAGVLLVVLVTLWPKRLEVETAQVTRGPLEVIVQAQGMTRVPHPDIVAAPFNGELEQVRLEPGDEVTKGQVVALLKTVTLDPVVEAQTRAELQMAQANQQRAAAQIAQAEAVLAEAQSQLERTRTLEQAGAVSRQALEEAELAARSARQQREVASAQARAAQAELAATRARLGSGVRSGGERAKVEELRAPSDGRILRVLEVGQRVVPAGTPILELGDLGLLEVVGDVLSTDAVRIRVDAPLRVRDWGGTDRLEGRVTRVEPSGRTRISALGVEEQRVDVVGRLHNAPEQLGHQYRVELEFVVWSDPEVLQVPLAALFRMEDGWGTYVAANGRALLRRVQIGARAQEAAVVLEGLEAGERVLVHPPRQLEEGSRIRDLSKP
jgi:HlyD family secretion protein